MTDRIEWRSVYREDKRVLFVGGRGTGDYYPAMNSEGVFRVRWWRHGKVASAEHEALVLSREDAEALLLEWLERARGEAA